MPTNPPSSPTYTVRAGDSLGLIATRLGTTLRALIDTNADRYPGLRSSPPRLLVGWTLNLPQGGASSNDSILFVGMNPNATLEAAGLKSTGAKVTAILEVPTPDQVKGPDGRVYDLSSKEEALAFARTFGLSPEQTERVGVAIHNGWDDARDELGRIAQVWAAAERGESVPSRLVLSGHSVGQGVWGENNGTLTLDSLADLADAMPQAARSIEDVHIAGCYSGGAYAMERIRAIFPRVKTIWAYSGTAPTGALAAQHEKLWEQGTRGSREDLDRAIALRAAAGDHVAVWSIGRGYQDGHPPTPLSSVRDEYELLEPTFDLFFRGDQEMSRPEHGPLRDYYNALQALLQHPELSAADRPGLAARRDVTIRLIYYRTTVAKAFAARYKPQIVDGYSDAGLPVPDFASLSRADALAQVKTLADRERSASPSIASASALLPVLTGGLVELNPSVIPDAWV